MAKDNTKDTAEPQAEPARGLYVVTVGHLGDQHVEGDLIDAANYPQYDWDFLRQAGSVADGAAYADAYAAGARKVADTVATPVIDVAPVTPAPKPETPADEPPVNLTTPATE